MTKVAMFDSLRVIELWTYVVRFTLLNKFLVLNFGLDERL